MDKFANEEKVELERERARLAQQLAEIDARLASGSGRASAPAGPNEPARGTKRQVPVRNLLLDSLADLGTMAFSRELALFAQARYGRKLSSTRFGSLSNDEASAFGKGRHRPVWLCHGLVADRGEAIKRLWGRSDWPLSERVVAPTTGRVQHLHMTAALCRIAGGNERVVDPEMMAILAADHARDVPGLEVRRGKFDLETWRLAAEMLLDELLPTDRTNREVAADQLSARLDDHGRLFGVPDSTLILLPPGEKATGS